MAEDTVVEDVEDTHPTPTFVRLIRSYLALEFTAGHILLPTLLSIFLFSRRCHRHPTLINVIIALIWASVLSSLLLWTGQTGGPRLRGTHSITCAVQGGLLIGCIPMVSVAVLALTCYTWRSVTSAYGTGKTFNGLTQSLLLTSPYLAYAPWIPAGIYYFFRDRYHVSRSPNNFYCTMRDDKPLEYAMGIFSGIVNITTIVFEVHLGWIYFRSRRVRRAIEISISSNSNQQQSDVLNIGFILRVLVFGTYSAISPVVSLLVSMKTVNPIGGLFAATIGVVFAITFGSRRDVLLTLMFWRRNPTMKGTTHTSQPAALPGAHAHADVVVEVNSNPTFGINRHTLYYPGNVESFELEDQKSSDYRAKL